MRPRCLHLLYRAARSRIRSIPPGRLLFYAARLSWPTDRSRRWPGRLADSVPRGPRLILPRQPRRAGNLAPGMTPLHPQFCRAWRDVARIVLWAWIVAALSALCYADCALPLFYRGVIRSSSATMRASPIACFGRATGRAPARPGDWNEPHQAGWTTPPDVDLRPAAQLVCVWRGGSLRNERLRERHPRALSGWRNNAIARNYDDGPSQL